MFLLTGVLSKAALATLANDGDAARLRHRAEAHAMPLGGKFLRFFFGIGDASFVAIVEIPRPAVARLLFTLGASDLVMEGTLRMNRVRTDAAGIDGDLRAAAELGDIWPGGALAGSPAAGSGGQC